jgi:hypothetical protein
MTALDRNILVLKTLSFKERDRERMGYTLPQRMQGAISVKKIF